MFDYATQANNDSMHNTPSTFSWYAAGRVFEWLKEQGGIKAIAEINERKANKLYQAIDSSDFYSNPVNPQYRSWMNVPFILADDKLDKLFLEKSYNANLLALKGVTSLWAECALVFITLCRKWHRYIN